MSSGVAWHSVTAIYGGTFDPPHRGHVEAVRGLFKNPGVGRVLVLPSAEPPHKTGATPAEHRLAMVELAMHGIAQVEIDRREIDLARATGRPSYSFETLQTLRRDRGEALAFVIGTDQLRALPSWYRFPDVLGLCHWIVLERKPGGAEEARGALKDLLASGLLVPVADRRWAIRAPGSRGIDRVLELVPTDAPALAAREVREALQRTGRPPQDALLEPVFTYLKTHRLYGSALAKQ
jgi:nicotinate-nucleotide adenylyltransferase